MGRSTGLAVVAIAACSLAFAGSASGATITVETTADTSATDCTLRNAITAANTNALSGGCVKGDALPTVDTIAFDPSVTPQITLNTALPVITSDLTIQGPGDTSLNIHRANAAATDFRVLEISSGTVSVSGLQFTHGSTTGIGGGIEVISPAVVSLDNVTVSNNATTDAGAGIASTGSLAINDTKITNNVASANAAGSVSVAAGGLLSIGTLSIDRSTISSNDVSATTTTTGAAAIGGGIELGGSSRPTIDRSTIANNTVTATNGTGGTVADAAGIQGGPGFTLRRSTVSGNVATASGSAASNASRGGGIQLANPGATLLLDRVTMSGNSVSAAAATTTDARGGGLFAIGATSPNVVSSTITANTAPTFANTAGGTFKNSIVSAPLGGGQNCFPSGTTSAGYNIDDGTSCGFTQPTDHPSTDPLFAVAGLDDNGGPTETIQIQAGSPAVDQGISSPGETTDQRERARPSDFGTIANAPGGDGTDIGAFERQDVTPPDTSITAGPDEGSTTTTRAPGFEFTATEPGSTFECDFDGGGFSACSTPYTAPSLTDGQHTLSVRATDPAHNTDQTAATRTFTIDSTAPVMTITSGPTEGSVSNRNAATFEFTSDDPGATVECAVDGGAFGPCSDAASDTIGPLAEGVHGFEVRGTDQLGNVGAPAASSFAVDTKPPDTTIDKKPKKHTHSKHARFTFTSNEQGATFQCSVGNAPFEPCESPQVLKHQKHGSHRFRVEAIDAAGNVDESPAHARWRVKR
jgi:hypothetical protein